MADRWAIASGNWSDTATWNGGTLPQDGDDVYADGYTVTIDQNVTVSSIRNSQRSGGTAGGGFVVSTSRAVIANIFAGDVAANALSISTPTGTVSVVGNVLGSLNSSGYGIYVSGNANVSITGNCTPQRNAAAIYFAGSGMLTFTGNTYSSINCTGGLLMASGSLVMVGDCIGNPGPTSGIQSIDGSYANAALYVASGVAATITGNVYGYGYRGILTAGTCSLTVTGAVAAISNVAIAASSGCAMTVTGTVQPSTSYYAITGGALLSCDGTYVSASNGRVPSSTPVVLVHSTNPQTHTYRVNNSGSPGVARSLYTGGQNLGQPDEADVREDTLFGVSNEYTGTLAVPPAGSVLLAVPTDDTVGTLVPSLSAEDIRAAVGLPSANLGEQLAAISDDIDASVLGTGARLVTITVVDLDTGDPIQDARVRLSAAGIGTRVKRTNPSGVVSFSADDADYDVTITAADHDFTPTTLTVNGNETVTYEMSGQDWPDSTEPDSVTVRWRVMSYTTRQPVGAAEATVYMRIRNGPYQDGFAWNRTADSDTTDASGYVSFANVPVHCTVEARLGATGDWIPVEIPSDATSPYDAAPLWGALPDA